MIKHHPVKFGRDRHYGSGDMIQDKGTIPHALA